MKANLRIFDVELNDIELRDINEHVVGFRLPKDVASVELVGKLCSENASLSEMDGYIFVTARRTLFEGIKIVEL